MARPPRKSNPSQDHQQDHLVAQHTSFEGPVPHPTILQGYEDILPGAAERILVMAENQSQHRIEQEKKVLDANEKIRLMQAEINRSQVRWVGVSDFVGQLFGLVVSLACVGGGVWLVYLEHDWAGAALFSIPIAGIIKAFKQKG
ncbi:DUF2335 domain-containing protein [Methylobacillus pratensis]